MTRSEKFVNWENKMLLPHGTGYFWSHHYSSHRSIACWGIAAHRGRADDMSSLEEVYGAAKDAAKDPSFQIDPAIYSRIPSGDGGDGPFGSVSWWAGSVTRQDVEQMFASVPNGTFLIRNASTAGYTLSFRYFEVHHVKINERDGKYGVCDENFFSEIGEMVEYFRKEDLAFYQKGQSEESK